MSNIIKNKIIGVTGHCRAGKDSLFNLLYRNYPNTFYRLAFADQLKDHLADFVSNRFDINIFQCSAEQKTKIRPLMIGYGMAQRNMDPNYWVKEVADKLNIYNHSTILCPVITDFRFENEVKFFKEKYGKDFVLVEVVRLDSKDAFPTEELLEMPKVRPYVDHRIEWNTVGDSELASLLPFAENFYNNWIK